MTGLEFLAVARISRVIRGIVDARTTGPQRHRRWLNRVPRVDAMPGEIMVQGNARVLIADMIWKDSPARIVQNAKFTTYSHDAPKFKLGVGFNEEMIDSISRIATNVAGADETGLFTGVVARQLDDLMTGIDAMQNFLCLAMMLDRGLSYDGPGIKFQGLTFGTPTALKVTSATPVYANPTTATPVLDTSTLRTMAMVQYGVNYNRIEMSTPTFQAIIATTEYQNKSKGYLPSFANALATNTDLMDMEWQRRLATNVFGMEIVLVDDRFDYQSADGEVIQGQYLPDGLALLSNSADDGNRASWDFATDFVTESMLMGLSSSGVIGAQGMRRSRGPLGYVTVPDTNLNPPNFNLWAVDAGFTRKHMRAATASIDFGAVPNNYGVVDPLA